MLFLRTGLPGGGKTLNTIKDLDEEHQPDPKDPTKRLHKDPNHPDLPPRTIYYSGIPELKTDKLKSKWIEFDTPEKWYEQPDGSVIVIDEAQRIFGTDGSRARPEKVARFETHRHQGLDIHLITQHPSLVMTHVRKLVGKHINYLRPYGRDKGIFRHEYEFCIDSPEKRSNFKQSQEERINLDPHYFGLYRSATVHTHKKITPSYMKKIPLYLAGVLIPVGFIVALGWYIVGDAQAEKAKLAEASVDQDPATGSAAPGTALKAPDKAPPAADLIQSLEPRLADIPSSAPRYDSLTAPKDFPRLICTSSEDPKTVYKRRSQGYPVGRHDGTEYVCQCYTQQVTKIATTPEFCLSVVTNGLFDDTRQPPSYASGNSRGNLNTSPSASEPVAAMQRGRAATSQQPAAEYVQDTRLTVVNSGKPGHLW